MEQLELRVKSRNVTGKKVRFLRREGITPVHLFGHELDSLALQCETAKLERTLALAGETRLITLKVNSERKGRPVLVREVQREPPGRLLHVDLYQVKMGEKVEVEIPVTLVGEVKGLEAKGFVLLHELDTLSVQCLPDKIPAGIEVDISSLTEPGQALRVKDIVVSPDIAILNKPEQVVATVVARAEEKVEEVKPVAEEAVKPVEEAAPAAEEKPKQE
ncbi:MAG: 50S ribosomal protein L25 [Chloroflexota bacterium]